MFLGKTLLAIITSEFNSDSVTLCFNEKDLSCNEQTTLLFTDGTSLTFIVDDVDLSFSGAAEMPESVEKYIKNNGDALDALLSDPNAWVTCKKPLHDSEVVDLLAAEPDTRVFFGKYLMLADDTWYINVKDELLASGRSCRFRSNVRRHPVENVTWVGEHTRVSMDIYARMRLEVFTEADIESEAVRAAMACLLDGSAVVDRQYRLNSTMYYHFTEMAWEEICEQWDHLKALPYTTKPDFKLLRLTIQNTETVHESK